MRQTVKARVSILVVDDDRGICEFLCDGLIAEGYLCSTATDGRSAMAKIESESFDIVLLDIRLPDISGVEILNRIHSSSRKAAAIVMTGIDSRALAVETMKCGALDYIVKPFSLKTIDNCIHEVMKNKRLLSRNEDETPCALNGHPDDGKGAEESYKEISAIARGVQTRYDLSLGQAKLITRETAQLARQLGLPERMIQRWVEARLRLDSEKRTAVKRSLEKLERSLPAQELLELMRPYPYTQKKDRLEN